MTIVRGTVPAELFGRREFGALLGRLARPQLIARAIAPVALTLAFPVRSDAHDHRRTCSLRAGLWRSAAYQVAIRKRARVPIAGAEMATPRGFRRGASWCKAEVSR